MSPLESAFFLAEGERLTLRDIYTSLRQLRGPLNTMFGCEVAMVLPNPTDEPVNLATGLLFSGASCVVGTLWAVQDISAALFSKNLHTRIPAGEKPAAAIRSTQYWLRGDQATEGSLRSVAEACAALEDLLASLLETDANLADDCRQMLNKITCHVENGESPFAHPYHWAGYVAIGAS